MAVIGASLVLVSGVVMSIAVPAGFIYAIPIVIVSFLGVIFTAISKAEFE